MLRIFGFVRHFARFDAKQSRFLAAYRIAWLIVAQTNLVFAGVVSLSVCTRMQTRSSCAVAVHICALVLPPFTAKKHLLSSFDRAPTFQFLLSGGSTRDRRRATNRWRRNGRASGVERARARARAHDSATNEEKATRARARSKRILRRRDARGPPGGRVETQRAAACLPAESTRLRTRARLCSAAAAAAAATAA